jgi:hypothetical protein
MEGTQKGGLSPKKKVRGMTWHGTSVAVRLVASSPRAHPTRSSHGETLTRRAAAGERVQRAIMDKVKKQAGK